MIIVSPRAARNTRGCDQLVVVLRGMARHCGKHSPTECHRQRQARTLSPPSPRTAQQPQACFISCRCFMASPVAQTTNSAGGWLWRQALSTHDAKTSKHLESASVSHRAAAASLLHQLSDLHGIFRCAKHNQCRCVVGEVNSHNTSARARDEHAP